MSIAIDDEVFDSSNNDDDSFYNDLYDEEELLELIAPEEVENLSDFKLDSRMSTLLDDDAAAELVISSLRETSIFDIERELAVEEGSAVSDEWEEDYVSDG